MALKQKNKARKPKQQRGIETKKRIVEAGAALFAEKGYHKTNALEIAARAGAATGSFYSYFNNKKEVLIEVIRNFYTVSTEKVLNAYTAQMQNDTAANYNEGKKLVHSMIEALYATHSINPSLHREMIAMVLLDKEICEINREEERKVVSAMTLLLNNYRRYIRVKDLEASALLLYRVSEEIIHHIRIMETGFDDRRLLGELEDMVCRYLLAEA